MLIKFISDAIEFRWSESIESKELKINAFSHGKERIIITKPSLAGFGVNWQHCHNVIFMGLTYSYEQLYQALRRSWRFGQKNDVYVHIVTTSQESGVLVKVKAKEKAHQKMQSKMIEAMKESQIINIKEGLKLKLDYDIEKTEEDLFTAYNGDCVDVSITLD